MAGGRAHRLRQADYAVIEVNTSDALPRVPALAHCPTVGFKGRLRSGAVARTDDNSHRPIELSGLERIDHMRAGQRVPRTDQDSRSEGMACLGLSLSYRFDPADP